MARITKKSVDEFYTDVGPEFLKPFRMSGLSINEMCDKKYGALLLDKPKDSGDHITTLCYLFTSGRYSDDRNNIFISEKVLKLLEKSNFDNMPNSKIRLPFKTFKIRFPKSSGLGACVFTVSRSSFVRFIGGSHSDIDESKEFETFFFTAAESYKNGKTPILARMNTIDQLLMPEVERGSIYSVAAKTRDLAVKFCILYSTGAISMENGHPLPTKYDKPKQGGKSFRFGFNDTEFNNEMFVRPHFRNLRDERYYKKEPYNEWEIGSRWTFVTGKTINAKSYTATNAMT